mmetsp:Transcript_81151/g.252009  ORF Transcript_81151/g.252009 Transcript_81151/m.252009 type:complete len:95 (+) Transcript_81151:180-464(+)
MACGAAPGAGGARHCPPPPLCSGVRVQVADLRAGKSVHRACHAPSSFFEGGTKKLLPHGCNARAAAPRGREGAGLAPEGELAVLEVHGLLRRAN